MKRSSRITKTRTILYGAKYSELRRRKAEQADERCEHCGKPAPYVPGPDLPLWAGQLAHKGRGWKRSSTMEDTLWLCRVCHDKFDGRNQKVVPAKFGEGKGGSVELPEQLRAGGADTASAAQSYKESLVAPLEAQIAALRDAVVIFHKALSDSTMLRVALLDDIQLPDLEQLLAGTESTAKRHDAQVWRDVANWIDAQGAGNYNGTLQSRIRDHAAETEAQK